MGTMRDELAEYREASFKSGYEAGQRAAMKDWGLGYPDDVSAGLKCWFVDGRRYAAVVTAATAEDAIRLATEDADTDHLTAIQIPAASVPVLVLSKADERSLTDG